MEAEFNIFTDFNQFLVFDATASFEDLGERWTDETVRSMFVQGERYIAVGTMRNFYAPVLVRMDSERSLPGSVDKRAQGILDVPSGVVQVSGPTDNGLSGGSVQVPPGTYRVEIQYLNLGSVAGDGIEGDDRYVVTLSRANI
ncbi:hypothetical protein [Arthrobacter sp. AD-310]